MPLAAVGSGSLLCGISAEVRRAPLPRGRVAFEGDAALVGGSMNRLAMRMAAGLLAAAMLPSSCGRPFAIGAGGGGASSTSSGLAGYGGAGGAPDTGGGGHGGTGGATPACTPGDLGTCSAGSYCRADTVACEVCTSFTRFHFAAASQVALQPPISGTTVLYPRLSPDAATLYFTYYDEQSAIPRRRIGSAPLDASKGSWGPWSLVKAPVDADGQNSGPLLLDTGAALSALVDSKVDTSKPVLVFDSSRTALNTEALLAANLDASDVGALALPKGKHDSDIAVAWQSTPPRFWWLSDATSTVGQKLVTATATDTLATPVPVTLDNGCVVEVVEGPWVTGDGKRLLFGAAPPQPTDAGACLPAPPGHARLYSARLDAQGQQISGTQAKPLLSGALAAYETTPSLSPNLCTLYFSRFDAAGNGQLFSAARN
jgi:hypothetical protein